MTRRRWLGVVLVAAAALAVTAAPTSRLRHLALPLWSDPSVAAPAARLAVEEASPGEAVEAGRAALRVPGRVSALLPLGDEKLFIATFDEGLFRYDPRQGGAPVAVGGLEGRERFVDALLAYDRHVVAATHRGAIVLGLDGTRIGVLAAGQAVSSLALVGDELVLGTAHGLWRASDDRAVGERGPDGETLRVTALARSEPRSDAAPALFVGTPDGVYVVATPLRAQVARWQPLVFGAPASSTNVVTALAAFGDGVVAGTDDGGLVLVDERGVRAAPFADVSANDVNAGALVRVGAVTLVGTEGAGLIAVDAARARRLGRRGRVTALAHALGQVWVGDDAGVVYAMRWRPGSSG